jgi:hypothetical protein
MAQRSLRIRRGHPYYRRSWRWWVADQSAWKLVAWGVGVLGAVSVAFTALQSISNASTQSMLSRFRPSVFVVRSLAMFRAVIGVSNYPTAHASHVDPALATIVGIIALFVPALLIATVLLRIWSVKAFVWRQEASVCLPWEVDDTAYAREKAGTEDGTIAVRFYKRLTGLRISDLRCDVYLRFQEVVDIDGSVMIRTVPLEVLGPSGERTPSRVWPISREGTTFTLWVPLDAPLDGGAVRTIQGITITDSALQTLLIRASGKVKGLGVDIVDEKWYNLGPDNLQIGRFAKVAVDIERDPRTWPGWSRFEEPARQALFVYGRLVNPSALREFYGHYPRLGSDYVRAKLSGFRRSWSVATDNTDISRRFIYRDPATGEAPTVQILFLNLEWAPDSTVEGVLLRVNSQMIAELMGSDGNFLVEDVTNLVSYEATLSDGAPDIVRTYLGRPRSIEAARTGLAAGTAVIAADFLQEVTDGMEGYDLVLRSAFEAESVPGVPVVPLIRQSRLTSVSVAEGRSAEQG